MIVTCQNIIFRKSQLIIIVSMTHFLIVWIDTMRKIVNYFGESCVVIVPFFISLADLLNIFDTVIFNGYQREVYSNEFSQNFPSSHL